MGDINFSFYVVFRRVLILYLTWFLEYKVEYFLIVNYECLVVCGGIVNINGINKVVVD